MEQKTKEISPPPSRPLPVETVTVKTTGENTANNPRNPIRSLLINSNVVLYQQVETCSRFALHLHTFAA